MNLDRIASSPFVFPALQQPTGNRIDVTLTDPVQPGRAAEAPHPENEAPGVGTIKGVLTPEENRTIVALFGREKGMYTVNGAHTQQPSVPGMHLDIRA